MTLAVIKWRAKTSHGWFRGIQNPFVQGKLDLWAFYWPLFVRLLRNKEDCVNSTHMGSYAFIDKQESNYFWGLKTLNSSRLLTLVTFTVILVPSVCTQTQIFYLIFLFIMLNKRKQKLDRKTICKRTKPEIDNR